MARNPHAGPSTLRNRNRVTNKTRLKIIKESIDADPIVLDEDEEKARVVSTAGVDAEDANEHHLQAVLSAAAASRHVATSRTRGAEKEKEAAPAAYIPTPDSTGKATNYDELYPSGRWRDSHEYLKSSDTVEESVSFALANGFIFYMDERDKEWLDKNNEEARGEGTSAQGALAGTSTRSGRSTKAKGKDPEVSQPAAMTEDEFELVMAVFEKVTHEKTEFLHHGLEQGGPFPPFSDYHDTFANSLPPTMFAIYAVPSWIPQPAQLLRFAKVVYPYWKERRMERGGHPIIPVVNLDETDTKNESYICFRRRESKAIRKTRAQQATYSDKMIRLQSELATAMDLANRVLQREAIKRENASQTKAMWEKRFTLVDLKRKFPALGIKEDEELFQDRERVPKKIKTDVANRLPLKLKTPREGETGFSSPVNQEPMMKPKDRQLMYQTQVDQELAKRKQEDHGWEDLVDNPYQPAPVPYPSRLFKLIPPSRSSIATSFDSDDEDKECRAFRLRIGRGGRRLLDRRILRKRDAAPIVPKLSESDEDEEATRRLAERWRFDEDDGPAFGAEGPEEQDRKLVDDFSTEYITRRCSLLNEIDVSHFTKDTSILLPTADGRIQNYLPYRSGVVAPARSIQAIARHGPSPLTTPAIGNLRHPSSNGLSVSSSGSSITIPQVKQMPPPAGMPHVRMPSTNGIIRPPGTPVVPSLSAQASPPRNSSPAVNGNTQDGVNGPVTSGDQDIKMTNVVAVHNSPSVQSDGVHAQSESPSQPLPVSSPMRPKSQTPTMTAIPNGFTIPSVNNYPSYLNSPHMQSPVRPNGLNAQMMKSALASLGADGSLQPSAHVPLARTNAAYLASQYQQQYAAARLQWTTVGAQRPQSGTLVDTTNGIDTNLAANFGLSVPARVPSANGTRSASIARGVASPALAQALAVGQDRVSPNAHVRLPHSSHMLSPGLAASQPHQSPPRPPQPPMTSPSLQSQVVGTSGTGY